MTNADRFKAIFGLYATELWAMPEKEFLKWLNADATDTNVATTDAISRAAVVNAIEGVDWYHINRNGEMVHGANDAEHQAWYKADDIYAAIERVPSAQPEIIRCKDCRYNNDCEIQYSAQSADEFFCGCAERKDNE